MCTFFFWLARSEAGPDNCKSLSLTEWLSYTTGRLSVSPLAVTISKWIGRTVLNYVLRRRLRLCLCPRETPDASASADGYEHAHRCLCSAGKNTRGHTNKTFSEEVKMCCQINTISQMWLHNAIQILNTEGEL